MLWDVSSLQRVAFCGRVPRSSDAPVVLRAREGVAGWAGLQHCGSVWACPVCSASILLHRALEIGAVLGQAIASGHSLGFVTLTMRHRRTQALGGLWDAAGKAWQRAISGKQWVALQGAHGVVGWVRVWEVTDGKNGWHVHVHAVVVLAPGSTAADLEAVGLSMFGRWSKGLTAAGLDAPRLVGQDWHLASGDQAASDLAGYLVKLAEGGTAKDDSAAALGLELTHGSPGRARSGLATKPPVSLLDDFAATGDLDSLGRWREYEAGSKGRRQVGWSKGLRVRFAPAIAELTDSEVVERETGSAADNVAALTEDGWRRLVAIPAGPTDVLEALEVGGTAAAADLLDRLGVGYVLVGSVPA